MSKVEAYAPLVAGMLFALPTLLAAYPPMTDLPLHESVVSILRHWGDAKYFPPDLYQLNIGHPNQLFYFIALPFAYPFGTTWAMKILAAGTQVGLFLAAARFAKHVGTPRWTALLVGALGLGWMYYWGLIANLLGLAVFLAVLPTLDAFVLRPTVRGGFASFAALLLLFLAHETAMLGACFMMALFAIGHPIRERMFLARLSPALGAAGVGVLHFFWAQKMRPPANAAIPVLFHPWAHKWQIIPGVLFAGYEVLIRTLMFAIAVLAIVLFAIERFRERPKLRGTPFRELYNRYRFEIFAGAMFVLYLTFPFTLSGATLFYHRFLPPAYAVIAIVLAPRAASLAEKAPEERRLGRLARIACATVPIGSLLIAWPSFLDVDRVTRDFDSLVELVDYGSTYIIVDVGPKRPERLFTQSPLEGHVVAERGGRNLFDFTRSPIAPAFMNPKYHWNEPYWRLQTTPVLLRPEHDLNRFRYLFFHTTIDSWGDLAIEALEPDARFLGHAGEWWLFESNHVKFGPLAVDDELPEPRPHTFRKRMKDAARRHVGLPIPPDPLAPQQQQQQPEEMRSTPPASDEPISSDPAQVQR